MPLSFRQRCIRRSLLVINGVAALGLVLTWFHEPWVIAAAAFPHAALLYAIFAPSCGWLGPVVTQFRPVGRQIWLTIDDGPSGANTEQLATQLSRRGVRATFFVKGCNLAGQPLIARHLRAGGHTIANHTHTHPAALFWWLWPARLRRELDGCNETLANAGVTISRWFRAPVGAKPIFLHAELARRGMRLIAWTVRGRDGFGGDPDAVARRIIRGVRPGAIVLLHEGRAQSADGILRTVEELARLGYQFVIPTDEQLL